MKNFYPFRNGSFKIFSSVAVFAFCAGHMNAQTEADKEVLKRNTNLTVLSRLIGEGQKKALSKADLRAIAKKRGLTLGYELPNGKIVELVGFDEYGEPIYYETHNANSAVTSGVNLLQVGGASGYDLSGKDIKVVEWDGGRIRASHQELAGKITYGAETDPKTEFSEHSTHVAGTILATGVDARAKGMAPDANIIGYDYNNNMIEIPASLKKQEGLLSTHSYGALVGWSLSGSSWSWYGTSAVNAKIDYKFGFYGSQDATVDEALLAAPWHTMIRSAGNHRGDGPATAGSGSTPQEIDGASTGGYDTVGSGSLAKNVISVGAVQPVLLYRGPESVKMTSFSSWGPADDGRIFPTIVADGYNVYSSIDTSDSDYKTMSGTSMATPGVTGAIALIQEFAKKKTNNYLSSPLIKSLITNTAKEAGNPGPDYIYGFGLLDAKAAVDVINYQGKNTDYKEGVIKDGNVLTFTYPVVEGLPFKATIAWLDRKGTPKQGALTTAFLNDRTAKLVDDLDMRVEQDGDVYMPYVLSPTKPSDLATAGDNVVDNIEQILVSNPKNGTVTIKISHKKTLSPDGVPFGLTVTGVAAENNLQVSSIVPAVDVTEYSAATPIKVHIKNASSSASQDFAVKFKVSNSSGVVKEEQISITTLNTGETREIVFYADFTKPFEELKLSAELVSSFDQIVSDNYKEVFVTPSLVDLTEGGSSMLENFNKDYDFHNWVVIDNNNDTRTWGLRNTADYILNGSQVAQSHMGGFIADEWLMTNPIHFKAGETYKISYFIRKFSTSLTSNRNDNLEVFIGDTPTVASMTQSLNLFTWQQSLPNDWVRKEFTFVAPKDGVQYLGLHHFSKQGMNSYNIGLEDFLVQNMAQGKPAPQIGWQILDGTSSITKYSDTKLYDQTNLNPDQNSQYSWSFEPQDVTYLQGTSSNSATPIVRFNTVGNYSVKVNVTNANGQGESKIVDGITVISPTLAASFTVDRPTIFAKENAQFTNTYTGSPATAKFKWTITPFSEGAFEYLEGTTDASEHINVKFNKKGQYTVANALELEEGVVSSSKSTTVTVLAEDTAPSNLKGELQDGVVRLNWEKPNRSTIFSEDFQGSTFPPTGWQVLDGNGNASTWKRTYWTNSTAPYNYFAHLTSQNLATDDYLVTPIVSTTSSEYSELSFKTEAVLSRVDNLKVYLIKTTNAGALSAATIKAGILIYDGPAVDAVKTKTFKIDLSSYLGSPYRIAFYGSNPGVSGGNIYTTIDDVKISKPMNVQVNNQTVYVGTDIVSDDAPGTQVEENIEYRTDATAKPSWPMIFVGYTSDVTSYDIYRDGNVIGSVNAPNTAFIDNTVDGNASYVYRVQAVYDSLNPSLASNSVTVSTTTLGTTDIKTDGDLRLFPNPVADIFKVKFAQKLKGNADVEIYSLDGRKVKVVSLNENQISNEGVNITDLSAGSYVIVIKNDSKVYTSKIIKK